MAMGYQVIPIQVHSTSLGTYFDGIVTDVHDVTGLIHGSAAEADASCIHLESFSFSLLCTVEYTHTVLPNFHIVTGIVTDVHDVTGLIHGPTAEADTICIYLESFSFSLFSVP